MMRLAIVGSGRMGQAVAALAAERGHTIHTVIGGRENAGTAALTAERLGGADVAVEFTRPEVAAANVARLLELGVPVVCGTTGWAERLADVELLARTRGGAFLHATNFSVGAHLFFRAAHELARLLAGRPEFDGFIVEAHHAAKRDAPSGTALTLRDAARDGDPGRPYPITSVRGGSLPGTHTLTYDAPLETISLEHASRSRAVFAAGALAAAEWLVGRSGVYTFDDMLFGDLR